MWVNPAHYVHEAVYVGFCEFLCTYVAYMCDFGYVDTCVCGYAHMCLSHLILSVAHRALESGRPEPYPSHSDQQYLCLNFLS